MLPSCCSKAGDSTPDYVVPKTMVIIDTVWRPLNPTDVIELIYKDDSHFSGVLLFISIVLRIQLRETGSYYVVSLCHSSFVMTMLP